MSGSEGSENESQRISTFLDGLDLNELQALSKQLGIDIPEGSPRKPYIERLSDEKSKELNYLSMATPFWKMQQQVSELQFEISNFRSEYDERLHPVDFVGRLFKTYTSTILTIAGLAALIGLPLGSQLWTITEVAAAAEKKGKKIDEALAKADELHAVED